MLHYLMTRESVDDVGDLPHVISLASSLLTIAVIATVLAFNYDRTNRGWFPLDHHHGIFPQATLQVLISVTGHFLCILGSVTLNALALVVLGIRGSGWAVLALLASEVCV